MEIHIGDRVAEVELVSKEDNKVVLTIDGKPFEADVVMAENGTCNILMDGRSANAQLIRKENGKSYKVNTHYSSFNVEIVDSQAKYLRMRKKGEDEQNDRITSPMPGKVVKIPVTAGQEMKTGDTVIVIEHNLDVLKSADHLIDLGPEGGDGGGTIVTEGTPEQVAQCEQSWTGKFLRDML